MKAAANTQPTAAERLDQYLASHGMRRTPERSAVLAAAAAMRGRFVAEDLRRDVAEAGLNVSDATVYRNLAVLVDAGLVVKVAAMHSESTARQYEMVRQGAAKSRRLLVCIHCGKSRAVRDPALARDLVARRFEKFSPMWHDLTIYGVCAKCKKNLEKRQSTV